MNPLDMKVEGFPTRPPDLALEAYGLYTGEEFIDYAVDCSEINVMCYSVTRKAVDLCLPLARIIYSTGEIPPILASISRYLPGSHVKLWLTTHPVLGKRAFIGSLNLCCPTQLDLLYKLPPNKYQTAKTFFFHYWDHLKPKT